MGAPCAAPLDFRSYRALTFIRGFPSRPKERNSGLTTVQILSLQSAFKSAFPVSATQTSTPFKAAYVNATRTKSRNTTDAYVIELDSSIA